MTANLLAHSDLFRAGIARSGAYNRTLTPFGFQHERRSFWQAPRPLRAHVAVHVRRQHQVPILLIHGKDDNNTGTFPIQCERLYPALKGNGGDGALRQLPDEAHGYLARESVQHVLAEMLAWGDDGRRTARPRRGPEASAPVLIGVAAGLAPAPGVPSRGA